MPGCAVADCTTYNRKTMGTNIMYHQFPKNEELRRVWVLKCKRKDNFNVKNSCICSKHFSPEDYERDLKAELMNYTAKPILKSTAIPSLNLPGHNKTLACNTTEFKSDQINNKKTRCEKRCVRKPVIDKISRLSPKKPDKITCSTQTDPVIIQTINESRNTTKQIVYLQNKIHSSINQHLKYKA